MEPRLRALGLRSLHLFGSTARDEAGPDSDIDVFVEFEPDAPLGWDFAGTPSCCAASWAGPWTSPPDGRFIPFFGKTSNARPRASSDGPGDTALAVRHPGQDRGVRAADGGSFARRLRSGRSLAAVDRTRRR
jgi:hypothetical protein